MQQRSVGGEKDVGVIALSPRKRPCHSAPVKRPAERRNLSRNRLAPAKAHDTRSRARRTSETRVERLGETAGVYKPPRPLRPPLFPSQRLALNCSRLPPAQHVTPPSPSALLPSPLLSPRRSPRSPSTTRPSFTSSTFKPPTCTTSPTSSSVRHSFLRPPRPPWDDDREGGVVTVTSRSHFRPPLFACSL